MGILSDTNLLFTVHFAGVDYQEAVFLANAPIGDPGAFYSYSQLMDAFNTTLQSIFSGIPGLPAGTVAPAFVFNSATQQIVFYFQASFLSLAQRITIYINTPLQYYLASLPVLFGGFDTPGGKDWSIFTSSSSATSIPLATRDGYPVVVQPGVMPGQVYALAQQVPVQTLMEAVSTIFLTTSTIPIQSEYQPFNSTLAQNAGFSTASNPIISDFALAEDNPMALRQKIVYLPTAEYRMIHLGGREPLRKIDVQFWYLGTDGLPYQISISPGQSCSVKLLFRRKGAW